MAEEPVAATVYVIESVFAHYNEAARCEEVQTELMEEEGWFATQEAAEARCSQLNDRLKQAHLHNEERRLREHRKEAAAVDQARKEAEVLRAAGFEKAMPAPCPKFVPMPFEKYVRSAPSSTSYEVTAVSRSEHDLPPAGPVA